MQRSLIINQGTIIPAYIINSYGLTSNHKKVLGLAKERSLHKEPTKVVIIKAQLIPKTYQSLL